MRLLCSCQPRGSTSPAAWRAQRSPSVRRAVVVEVDQPGFALGRLEAQGRRRGRSAARGVRRAAGSSHRCGGPSSSWPSRRRAPSVVAGSVRCPIRSPSPLPSSPRIRSPSCAGVPRTPIAVGFRWGGPSIAHDHRLPPTAGGQTAPAFWNARASIGLCASRVSSSSSAARARAPRRSSRCQPCGGVSARTCRSQSSPARAAPSAGVSSQTVRSRVSNVNVAVAGALHPDLAH